MKERDSNNTKLRATQPTFTTFIPLDQTTVSYSYIHNHIHTSSTVEITVFRHQRPVSRRATFDTPYKVRGPSDPVAPYAR